MTPQLLHVRKLVAQRIPKEADARRLARDAGLSEEAIEFGGTSVNQWDAVFRYAIDHDKMGALLDRLREEREDDGELTAAIVAAAAAQEGAAVADEADTRDADDTARARGHATKPAVALVAGVVALGIGVLVFGAFLVVRKESSKETPASAPMLETSTPEPPPTATVSSPPAEVASSPPTEAASPPASAAVSPPPSTTPASTVRPGPPAQPTRCPPEVAGAVYTLLARASRPAGATAGRVSVTVNVSGGIISVVSGTQNDLFPAATAALNGRSVGGSQTCTGANAVWAPPPRQP